jgi:hypothetical protein
MKTLFVLIMLWTNPNNTDGHLVLKADYTSSQECFDGLNHAQSRSTLLDTVPDDLTFECVSKDQVDASWLSE